MDASFLLTVEVFVLTVRLFCLQWGNRRQKKTKPSFQTGGTLSKEDQPIFHRKQKGPNRISTVSKQDQTN